MFEYYRVDGSLIRIWVTPGGRPCSVTVHTSGRTQEVHPGSGLYQRAMEYAGLRGDEHDR